MRFSISRPAEDVSGRSLPGMILVDRCDFLDTYRNEPALCRAERAAISAMLGSCCQAEAEWYRTELDAAAALMRLEKGCRSLVLSIQQSESGPRVVYDAE